MTVIKDVSGNSDSGTATRWGGNNIMILDNYLDDIDVSASIVNGLGVMRINTLTRYRSGKLSLRDSGNDHNYTIITSNITANRNLTIPLITADDTFATRGLDNNFTTTQTITHASTSNLLTVYRASGSVGDEVTIGFDLQDSLGNKTNYGWIETEITDNTDGSEDARMDFVLRNGGGTNARLRINSTGLVEVFAASSLTDVFRIDRDTAGAGNAVSMLFRLNDALGNNTDYGGIRVEIVDDTDASEDGKMIFKLQNAGSSADRMIINTDGSVEHILNSGGADALWLKRPRNTVGDNVKINFQHHDSTSAYHTFAQIQSEIVDNTNGSEDGRLEFLCSDEGSLLQNFVIHDNGNIDIPRGGLDILDDGNADMLDLERSDNTVGNQNGINFWLEDSTNALHKYGRIHSVIITNTNGAEDGDIVFSASDAGTFAEVARIVGASRQFRLVADEWETLDIYRPNSTVDDLTAGLMFSKNNASATAVGIGFIEANLKDNTAGAEDSSMQFWTRRAGANKRVMNVDQWGVLTIGPDSGNAGTVSRNVIRSGTAVNFNNTSAEQTLFTQNILANTLSAHGHLHLLLIGSIRQQTSTSTTYTLRIKFGGTTYYEDAVLSSYTTSSANFLVYNLQLWLFNTGVTNTQGASLRWMMGDSGGVPTTGWGDITDDEIQGNANGAFSPSQDTTIDRTLAVTMQMSTASVSCEVNVDYKWLEINP